MLKLIAALTTLLTLNSSFARYEPVYLNAGNEFYNEIIGNGLEYGFHYTFEILSHDQVELAPTLLITNNSADCWESEIKLVKQVLAFTSQYSDRTYYYYTFAGTINTSVEGDTGGCLVTIKKDAELEADILKIIDYRYITDY